MKSYKTAEQFEEEAAKLQQRCDRFASRIGTFILNKLRKLHDELSDDQKERVRIRQISRAAQEKSKIIHPGSKRFN